jgi:DNA-binding response OmpR family regulator
MKPASILVTDDESNIRMMLRTALESDGYSVQEAANGREALEALKHGAPDLMVLDLNMPVIDGMAVLEQMKTLTGMSRPRVIILTAYGSIPAAVKATRLGAVDFLEKPITPSELRATVRSVLDEPELDAPREIATPATNYDGVLDRIRKSLRMADYENAESLLMRAADQKNKSSAEYFNLLGILYESQRKWRLARKCYGKAITTDKQYEPAQSNLRRLYELQTVGHSSLPVYLGDEPGDVVFFRMPDAKGSSAK